MSAATSAKKTAKTPKAKKVVKAATKTKVAKNEAPVREDERVNLMLAALIKTPTASEDDLAKLLANKDKEASASMIRLVVRGFRQTYRALSAAKLIVA
jgi:hypothetical protein